MVKRKLQLKRSADSRLLFEPVERRELLSGAHFHSLFMGGFGRGFGGFGSGDGGGGGYGMAQVFVSQRAGQTITFSEAPAVVQTGLTTLAANESLSAPTADQKVVLGNSKGIETYTIKETGTGITAKLTVDVTGTAVSKPVVTTTTFGDITNTAVTGEITTIATALNLTAPDPTASVTVSTPQSGAVTYTISLAKASGHGHVKISVDDSGNPVGNETLPLSVFLPAVQNGLNNAPAGATALTPTSNVVVKTQYGVTTYSARYTGTGLNAIVTVNEGGDPFSLPSTTTVQFSTIPAPAQTELQTLATDAGVTATIDPTQNVQAFDEANETTIYSVRLTASKTGSGGGTYSYLVMLSVDQAGNPTVLPSGSSGRGDGGFFGGFGWC